MARSKNNHLPSATRDALSVSRREALFRWANGFGGLALSGLLASCSSSQRVPPRGAARRSPGSKARHVIFLYMDGGPSQIDTFDPKPRLAREHGREIGMPTPATQFAITRTVLKSPFAFRKYGQSGTEVSEIFPEIAQVVDELAIVRSMVSEHSEHSAANFFLHTGWPRQGRPTMGSWTVYGLGHESQQLPGFVLLDCGQMPLGGRDCFTQGFLPSGCQPTILRPRDPPVANIRRQERTASQQRRKVDLIAELDREAARAGGQPHALDDVIANLELAFQMQTAIPELYVFNDESRQTLSLYGIDRPECADFGKQCLLARRLVERGVRFVQLLPPPLPEHNHWDQHTHLAEHHRSNARAVDRPIFGLLTDLRQRGLLDETVVLWGGEFGRTPMAQEGPYGKVGRDHNPFGFTMWLAGGGVRGGTVYGATDEYGYYAVDQPVTIHDLHATLLHLLGLDHTQLTYRWGGRDFRLTDVYGDVVEGILA